MQLLHIFFRAEAEIQINVLALQMSVEQPPCRIKQPGRRRAAGRIRIRRWAFEKTVWAAAATTTVQCTTLGLGSCSGHGPQSARPDGVTRRIHWLTACQPLCSACDMLEIDQSVSNRPCCDCQVGRGMRHEKSLLADPRSRSCGLLLPSVATRTHVQQHCTSSHCPACMWSSADWDRQLTTPVNQKNGFFRSIEACFVLPSSRPSVSVG